ncbi:M50 family metallopeptidase [Rothia kristinae]|uniref:M50 family metallopeptidase n=1 Tax=Rothia kristinae TaxID=37923 RepID=UPI000736B137|nr:site-2 protease family protein [Rothia kristinae]KTR37244.1 zinc metalloprotease [Rothia kristinae]KTR57057.1 zinc metalloprotease [Rothia kristinae]KTR68658.1 zinc metalloprotease [Rothia kristinae]KTR70644.1 zinc metalloprotease [Rothia kristinae]KTR74772.1 zinc metalloprotease [Rothia kristinae]
MDLSTLFSGSWPLFLLGVVLMVLGIAASIALHEIGHLVPAKLFGVRVTQYMIGFGKTLFSRRRGETEYGIKAIPLGGYISMIGMYPPAGADTGADAEAETPSGPRGMLRRMAAEARAVEAEKRQPGDEDRQFHRLPIGKRIIIMLGGPCMNLLIGLVCLSIVVVGFGTAAPTTTVGSVSACVQQVRTSQAEDSGAQTCTDADPQAPAHAAGIRAGDRLISFDGREVTSWDQVSALIREDGGKTVPVVVERDGQRVQLSITPITTQRPVTDAAGVPQRNPDGTLRTREVGFIGVSPVQDLQPGSIRDVPGVVGQTFASIAGVIVKLPVRVWDVGVALFSGQERPADSPMSVVGVGRVAGEVASAQQITDKAKAASLISVLGTLNLSLFAFNLIPLLPLDGGHVAGALWEGIRRGLARLRGKRDPGPFDPLRLMPLTYVVVLAFLGMSVLLIAADLLDPVKAL